MSATQRSCACHPEVLEFIGCSTTLTTDKVQESDGIGIPPANSEVRNRAMAAMGRQNYDRCWDLGLAPHAPPDPGILLRWSQAYHMTNKTLNQLHVCVRVVASICKSTGEYVCLSRCQSGYNNASVL